MIPKGFKILFHTQYYPPEVGAPQARISELAEGLSRHGFEVSVLTAMPNYPSGRISPGYRSLFRKERVDGIVVYRAGIIPSQSTGLVRRLLNYFSFVCSSFFVGLFLPKPDVIITESPPLFLGISGLWLARINRCTWIFNVADVWPRSALELGLIKEKSIFYKVSSWLEAFFYRQAALVSGQSKTILADINARFPEVKTYHLSNGVDASKYQALEKMDGPACVVMYAGLHGLAQGLEQVVEAADLLRKQSRIRFVLVGDGPEKKSLMQLAQEKGLDNICFENPIPKAHMPEKLAGADMLIIPLKVQLTGAIPSKLFEGMAAAKPLILIAGGEAAAIVQDADCGIVVEPGDSEGLVRAINALAADASERQRLGENGRKAALEKYDRNLIVKDFAGLLKTMHKPG